jgi:hypothetical protein
MIVSLRESVAAGWGPGTSHQVDLEIIAQRVSPTCVSDGVFVTTRTRGQTGFFGQTARVRVRVGFV